MFCKYSRLPTCWLNIKKISTDYFHRNKLVKTHVFRVHMRFHWNFSFKENLELELLEKEAGYHFFFNAI